MKLCSVCIEDKEDSEFYPNRTKGPNVLQDMCKSCSSIRRKQYYKDNLPRKQELQKALHLRKTYDLSVEQVNALKTSQKDLCAICKQKPDTGRYKDFYVDHSHETKAVRGLLCYRCNMLLGYAKENLEVLRTAIDYLQNGADIVKQTLTENRNVT